MRFLSALAFAFAFSFAALAQTTDQSYTIEEYVTDVLIGDGINVSNITFTGSEEQIGYMSGAGGVFSVDAGVVLSTDNALNLTDPICGANACTGCLGGGVDQDLLNVANSVPPLIGQSFTVSSVNDLCILEFDFEAAGDSISFNYVFIYKNNKTEALDGYNDDLVMSYSILLWIRDTAIRIQSERNELQSSMLGAIGTLNEKTPIMTGNKPKQNPYEIDINGEKEDLSWLLG